MDRFSGTLAVFLEYSAGLVHQLSVTTKVGREGGQKGGGTVTGAVSGNGIGKEGVGSIIETTPHSGL